ncbi:MAG: endonuclease III [Candidatus Lloydbacteria bacterium CG22_combo_CG10-13_8_21_14_all_47_15]|uniref:Endonuclease III n=1 Tax=Candidatus Lloydbacteria bacterium CG22_combo_CG10-13_8_21_14_all_47_15 TaxID=1974635 RepID=A0A2H0CTH2_9BACT|nr:MAG: endonuclease III [Candidatus Lloydbacteria bacterium CG22_combo_CG10-13_8_21_14_all_47_15]
MHGQGKQSGTAKKKVATGRGKRSVAILRVLKKLFPNPDISLRYSNNWELLVAVMLSAQCTDKKVNEVTARLFKKYTTLDAYCRADRHTFEKDIRATGFFRNKAKHILATARILKCRHRGRVPCTMEEMLGLPGVARKTANVVLGNACGVVEGIAVDTHVRRFARRFDLTNSSDPKIIERDLMELFPKKEWFKLTYRFIEYGRRVCPARRHECTKHPLTKIYPVAAHRWLKIGG